MKQRTMIKIILLSGVFTLTSFASHAEEWDGVVSTIHKDVSIKDSIRGLIHEMLTEDPEVAQDNLPKAVPESEDKTPKVATHIENPEELEKELAPAAGSVVLKKQAASPEEKLPKAPESNLVAVADGLNIYQKDLEKELAAQFGEHFSEDISFESWPKDKKESFIEGIIGKKLLGIEAKRSGVDALAEYKEEVEKFKSQLLKEMYLADIIDKKLTKRAVQKRYKKMVKSLKKQKEYHIRHILVKTEPKAKEVLTALQHGQDFAALARQFSLDKNSKQGGDLGYITKGEIHDDLEKVFLSLDVGDISKPTKTEFGWHILKLEEKRKMKIPSFEEAERFLSLEIGQEIAKKHIRKLIKKASVKMYVEK